MENNYDLEALQNSYMQEKEALAKKLGILAICFAVVFVVIRIISSNLTFFEVAETALGLTLGMYLPFKIGIQTTGSIIGGMLSGVVLVIVLGLLIGDKNLLFGLILFGGMAIDLGWSIVKVWKLRKLLTSMVVN